MSTGRKLLSASIGRVVFGLTQIAIGFVLMPFLLKHFGNRWYGIWTVLSSLVAYFYMMDVGLGYAVQLYCARHVATRNYDRANAVINTALVIYGCISILILLITIVLALFVDHFVGQSAEVTLIASILLIMGLNIALEFPFNAFSGLIGAYSRFDLLAYSRLGMLLVTTALTFYFIGRGYDVLALAVIYLICGQLSNLSFFFISRYCFPQLRIGLRLFEWSQAKELATYSAWSMLTLFSSLFKFKMQPAVIAYFWGPVVVTHYAIGARLSDYFRDFLFKATNLAMPVLTKYHVLQQTDEIREKLRFLIKVNTALAVCGAGVIIVLGESFIARWLGPEYRDAYPVLVVLVLGMTLEIMVDPLRTVANAMGQMRVIGVLEMAEAIVNVALTIVLVRSYGMMGAALGTAIPLLLFKLFIVPRVLCRHAHVEPRLFYTAMAPGALTIAAYLLLYGWFVSQYLPLGTYLDIVLAGFLALPLYVVIAYFLFEPREVQIIRRMLPFFAPRTRREQARET